MSTSDLGGLPSDKYNGGVIAKDVKLEPDPDGMSLELAEHNVTVMSRRSKIHGSQESKYNRSSSALSSGQSGTSVLDQEQSPCDYTSPCSTSPIGSAPLRRQFWKAGKYDDVVAPNSNLQNSTNHLRIHPKFLHSNATSHKWVFGAIAELIDNAVDEIQNGATFVVVDKTINPRNGASGFLIQDDGGGMDPEAMRRCLSFGFSNKKSMSAIGQYGNGFKTSSMRLGADVIVFSRHKKNRTLTQSIGLLSYSFLTQTGHDRIVVPMVDYEFNPSTGTVDYLKWQSKENYTYNLSVLLQWSPYSTEKELLKQFDDIGHHGTKVIIYNLWFNDESTLELDFETDSEDIHIAGEAKKLTKGEMRMSASEQHIANRLRYSLRAYLSVLYLRLPSKFCMLLRGKVVEYHNIASDLKYPEFILYKPHSGRCVEGEVITTIGFLKEAPHVNIHGFNVYHKNRLILPFWRIVSFTDSRGRGVVGVLEANFIEPSHNKQDFEKTNVFQKLEVRLKEMTWEYWDYHCGFIGYQVKKKPRAMTSTISSDSSTQQPVMLSRNFSTAGSALLPAGTSIPLAVASSDESVRRKYELTSNQVNSQEGVHLKRRDYDGLKAPEKVKRKVVTRANVIDSSSCLDVEPTSNTGIVLEDQEDTNLMQENSKLGAREGVKRKVVTRANVIDSSSCLDVEPTSNTNLMQENSKLGARDGVHLKRRDYDGLKVPEKVKRKAVTRVNAVDSNPCLEVEPISNTSKVLVDQEGTNLMQENRKLHAQCLENERKEALLKEKVNRLRTELEEAQSRYTQLLAESQLLEKVKVENKLP